MLYSQIRPIMKQCKKCNETKPLDQFYDKNARCILCVTETNLLWIKNNTEKRRIYVEGYEASQERIIAKRAYQLFTFYWPHLTPELALKEYNKLLTKQKHCCALCDTPRTSLKRDLSVDHCHITGKVRGLLCNNCNRCVVRNHTIESATRLLKYLKR